MAKREQVPFVKRPLEEIVAAARAAGREAFTTKDVVYGAWIEARSKWLEAAMPSGLGMSDGEFDTIMVEAANAYGMGVDDYLECVAVGPAGDTKIERERSDHQFELQCASEVFDWLRGIFDAIDTAADNTTNTNVMRAEVKRLASCGSYLASDRCDLLASSEDA